MHFYLDIDNRLVHHDAHCGMSNDTGRNQYAKNHCQTESRELDDAGRRQAQPVHPSDHLKILIPVPRHKELTPMTARSIAKAAGWN